MMKFALLLVVVALDYAAAHGHMTVPASRVELAFRAGLDYCPHCTLWDVVTGLEPYQGRPYPGGRPFAQPGEGYNEMGPCGRNAPNDYNFPAQVWGGIVNTFASGQVIEVEWMANANHIGVYSYRVCQEEAIVAPFLNPAYIPTQGDYDEFEKCLQEGILPCNSLGLNNRNCAGPAPGTEQCDPSWGCNNPEWMGQGDRGEVFYRDVVQLPPGFRSNHTLLTWRWDALDTPQVYTNCADVTII